MKIVVLMGGWSDEREVSLASGAQVARGLREMGHEVVAFDPALGMIPPYLENALLESAIGSPGSPRPGGSSNALARELLGEQLSPDRVDLFFVALHGGAGEDGTVQGLLEMVGASHTGSDRLGCSLAMDKEVTKRLLRDAGIHTPDWMVAPRKPADVIRQLGLPVVVKAVAGGSSLRLALAHDEQELRAVMAKSESWQDLVIFERYHPGRELTVAVLGREALPVGEIVPKRKYFDYECKYRPGMAEELFPAPISTALAESLQTTALEVFGALRLRDFARIDFMVDDKGVAWCLEANAAPGMTANSLLPKAALAGGIRFGELCDRIARVAFERCKTGRAAVS